MLDFLMLFATFSLIPVAVMTWKEAKAFLEWAHETPEEAIERYKSKS